MKNLYLTLALIIIFILKGTAQEIQWQKTIGGSSSDVVQSIQQTSEGGYIIGGYSSSDISGDKAENSTSGLGDWDYWIVKVDSLGSIQWQNTIGGIDYDILSCIQQTNDEGYILGGYSLSDLSGDKTESSIGQSDDYWIVKVDSLGAIQWQNTIGGSLYDQLESIEQTTDGGYILCGYSESYISGDKTENCNGWYDYWIVKIDSLGNIQWQNTIGGDEDDVLTSIQQTTDGGYILGGHSRSNIAGDKTEGCIGGFDYWIVKVDSIGNIQWQNTIGGSGDDYLYSLQQTIDGGYFLGGWSDSDISGNKTENSNGGYDIWIVKVNSIGNIQWQNTIGGSVWDELQSVQQTTDGDYILGGSSESNISGDKTENSNGARDYWIVKVDSLGVIQWQNTIGGMFEERLYSIYKTTGRGCFLGGSSNSIISGDKSANCYGGDDFWIIKIADQYNLISGKLFADLNNNGLQDNGEPALQGKKITEQGTGRFSFSQTNGKYSVSVLDTGSYSISPDSQSWYNPNPSTYTATFTGINQIDSLNDFAYQPSSIFDDLCVTITPLGAFRSGFNATYQISYANTGTTTLSPIVCFYPDTNLNFLSASLAPSQIATDSVIWNLPALTPFQSGSIIITVNVDLGLSIGTLINSSSKIEPLFTDADASNNTSHWPIFTTGSFDPNDILVDKAVLTTTQLSTNPWLEYIIRFQNTGNDTAFTVKILNPIDTNKLDISSIEFVNASHPVNINWINYQRNMEFKFENILLPDSNTNEPLSHGFVRYRIKPKTTLTAGDTIPNFAAIYFDFNDPIITNTAKTNIVLPTGLAGTTTSPGKLLVFPNPAENSISISGIQLENGKAQFRLMDIYGKLILEKTVNETSANLETNQLSKGVYLLESGGKRATFVKQ